MHAEIVSIGEELLSSDSETIDTNSIFITKQLGSIGIRVLYKTTVGDDETRITEVLKLALARADVIITTGGLGPTVDDMTRQAVANAFGVGLSFHQDLLDDIAAKFARFNTRMSDNNRLQAMLPDGATPIHNPAGTAPGFSMARAGKYMLSLPGVPREMKAMMEQSVIPFLKEKIGALGILKTRVLRTAGIGESLIDEQIGHLERLTNPTVGLNAHAGQTDIRITARAATWEDADALIAPVEAEIREKLGEHLFGVDKETLEQAFADVLNQLNYRAVVCEIGTEGALARRLSKAFFASPDTVEYADSERISALYHTHPDPREGAHRAVQSMRVDSGRQLAILLVTEPEQTVIAVCDGDETRTRTYNYGINVGAQEWAAGWGISMAWYMVRRKARAAAS
ncbi:MAG: hypothetical protein OHK0023_08170 [Anaerolineae bacterium]